MHRDVEEQLVMRNKPSVLVGYYNEGILQMSMIVYYALAFPLAPLFSYLTNLIDFDIKLKSLAKYDRRSWCEQANGIGEWLGVMEFMSFVSIPMNIAICYFTRAPPAGDSEYEKQSEIVKWLIDRDPEFFTITNAILIIVMIEHILIIFKIFLAGLIPDVPQKVHDNDYKRDIQKQQAQAMLKQIKESKNMKSFNEILAEKQKKEDLATIASARGDDSINLSARAVEPKEGTDALDPTKAPKIKKLVDNNHEAMKYLVERNSVLVLQKRKSRREMKKGWNKIREEQLSLVNDKLNEINQKTQFWQEN